MLLSLLFLAYFSTLSQCKQGIKFWQPPVNTSYSPNKTTIRFRYSDEQRIANTIFADYDPQVRPVMKMDTAVTVFIGLNLIQIFDLDEKNQILIANLWLDMEWADEYLTWDPREFNNQEIIRIRADFLWIPDIVLYNNAEEYKEKQITRAVVRYDGTVIYPVPSKVFSSCKIDVTYFPFDEQFCHLKYGSWSYNAWRVDTTNRTEDIDTTNYVSNGEWDVAGLHQQRHLVFYSCCIEPYSDVTFYIRLRRKSLYYFVNVFFPSLLMSTMTILVFLLPSDSHQKITLGITTLLSYSVFTLSIVQKLPETSEYFPLINVYLASVLTATSLSILASVIILSLHYRSLSSIRPLPNWVKLFFFEHVGPFICIPEPNIYSITQPLKSIASLMFQISSVRPSNENKKTKAKKKTKVKNEPQEQEANEKILWPSDIIFPNRNKEEPSPFLSLFESRSSLNIGLHHLACDQPPICPNLSREDDEDDQKGSDENSDEDSFTYQQLQFAAKNCQLNALLTNNLAWNLDEIVELMRIVQAIKQIVNRDDKARRKAELVVEWQHLAVVVDRLLFIFFLLVTVATAILLVLSPQTAQPNFPIKYPLPPK